MKNYIAVIEEKQGKTLTIKGRIVSDPLESRLIKDVGNGSCLLCSAGVDVKHTVRMTYVLLIIRFLPYCVYIFDMTTNEIFKKINKILIIFPIRMY